VQHLLAFREKTGRKTEMPIPREQIEVDTLSILKRVSGRPIEPTLQNEVVADLGFDSVAVLELVNELEEHFNITVPLNNLAQIKTVAHMVDHISSICARRVEV
jgi:acyl carrier protein